MTADYARGQPASAWPLAGQPCRVDCDLHTIARAHNNTFFVRPIGTLGPDVAAVVCVIMCTPIMHSGKIARSSQARFGGLTLVSRAPWLLVTGAPGLFSWPNTLWTTAVACRMSPTSRTGQAAASRRHRHRNSRGAAGARPWATHAGMDAT